MNEQFAQLGQQNSAVPRQPDLFDELRMAQQRFHQCCRTFQEAHAARQEAEKVLHAITEKAAAVIQMALNDPTVPQAANPQVPGNGRY